MSVALRAQLLGDDACKVEDLTCSLRFVCGIGGAASTSQGKSQDPSYVKETCRHRHGMAVNQCHAIDDSPDSTSSGFCPSSSKQQYQAHSFKLPMSLHPHSPAPAPLYLFRCLTAIHRHLPTCKSSTATLAHRQQHHHSRILLVLQPC